MASPSSGGLAWQTDSTSTMTGSVGRAIRPTSPWRNGRAGEVVDAALTLAPQSARPMVRLGCTFSIRMPLIRPRLLTTRSIEGNLYYGEVVYVDHALGPLLDVAASGSRPTLVIVTADHGEGLGDHGELTHGLFAYD